MTVDTAPVPVTRERPGLRLLAYGLVVDVMLSAGMATYAMLAAPDFAWSAGYWRVVGLSVAKTALMSGTSYLMRTLKGLQRE